ncbi:dethiobiotin synthase [Pseudomaricurvus sp. HS19]|uniref:dethiobiotin synthase n=1 Tax=Pseudomaricurvus sp. HS19 TaxID=2692626 RepID=UPI00136C4ACD|nr:dethiobiotin synthase [Pseudomaricurvus sp. HS19]MYM64266.1 dethiobiotin synthase [Pseudomaricurvus sp. HS19]
MAKKKFFIAGTDTDVGKTLIACGLLEKARQQGLRTAAIKPVAAGCEETPDGLRNSDALALQAAMTSEFDYSEVNPVALRSAIAPHIAAQQEGRVLSAARLAGYCQGLFMAPADLLLVEGAGGWRVPLNPRENLSQLAQELQLPVVLVVGMKLGCLNHALLTAEAIQRDGLVLAGWVANRVDPDMNCYEENVATLKGLLKAPCLGEVPHLAEADAVVAAQYLSLEPLLGED